MSRIGERDHAGHEYIGNLSSAPEGYSVQLTCGECMVWWVGCAAAAQCPRCGSHEGFDYVTGETTDPTTCPCDYHTRQRELAAPQRIADAADRRARHATEPCEKCRIGAGHTLPDYPERRAAPRTALRPERSNTSE